MAIGKGESASHQLLQKPICPFLYPVRISLIVSFIQSSVLGQLSCFQSLTTANSATVMKPCNLPPRG